MYIPIRPILFFVLKAVLIEWTIEALRFMYYFLKNKQAPNAFFRSNEGINLYLNGVETLGVVGLLYYAFHPTFIVFFMFVFIFCVETITKFISLKSINN